MRCPPRADTTSISSIVSVPAGPPPGTTRRRHHVAPKVPFLPPQPPILSSSSTSRPFWRRASVGPKFLGWHQNAKKEDELPSTVGPPHHGCTFTEGFSYPPGNFLPRLVHESSSRGACTVATGPRAIWSDADQLRSSDGFNMKKWRAEFADELAKLRRKASTRLSPKSSPNEVGVAQGKAGRKREASPVLPSVNVVQAQADEYFLQQDPMLAQLIRDEVGSGLALREICAKENAKRRRQLIDDTGHMHRRVAAQRRSVIHCHTHHRSVVSQEDEEIPEVEDSDMLAREERVQQAIARIQCRRSGEAIPPLDSSPTSPMMKGLRSRVKFAVTWRLEQRRKQAKKLMALKESRLARVNALPESERTVLQESFDKFSREVQGRQMVQVLDLPKCLTEAGLSGTNCLERWRVDRACKEMVFALTLEYSSYEKIPPIGSFRGSLIPRALKTANRCNSLQDIAGPSLEKLRTDEDVFPSLEALPEEENKWRESFSDVVASSRSIAGSEEEEESEQPTLFKNQSCPETFSSSPTTRSSEQPFKIRCSTVAFAVAENEGEGGESPSRLALARKRQSTHLSLFAKLEEKRTSQLVLQHQRLEGSSFAAVSNGIANVEVKLWRQSTNLASVQESRLRRLVGAAKSIISAKRFMLSRPICFEDFAAEIVPAVRAELMEIRQDVHFDEFMQVLGVSDSGGAVCLSFEEYERLAMRLQIDRHVFERIVALLPEQEPEPQKDYVAVSEATEASTYSKETLAGLIPLGTFTGNKEEQLIAEKLSPKCKVDPRLTFETVHEMLIKMEELGELEKRAAERRIMERTGMSVAKFWEHRSELIRLHEYFDLYDSDNSSYLSHKEVKQLLKHVGMQPYKREEGILVNTLLEETESGGREGLSFNEFLDLMVKVREYQKQRREKYIKLYFRKYAEFEDRLDLAVVDKALMEAGISGRTRMEQDLQRKLIYDWDVDNSGDISFEEFGDMCQRIQERLHSHKMEEIVRHATSLGIERQRLSEYICAYDQFDSDNNGGLSMEEIDEVLHMWCPLRPPTTDELQELFDKVGIKRGQEVPLTQFLDIMQIASVGRGMFARELPFTLRDISLERLREILGCFNLGKSYIETLDLNDLLELVSSYLGVRPDSNLREELDAATSIGSDKLLIDYAKRLHRRSFAAVPEDASLGQALSASLS